MNILLTNDDGIHAPGIRAMQRELQSRGHNVLLVAPAQERSGASHSITIHTPLCVEQPAPGEWAVHGTPVDCVFLAKEAIVKDGIDLVISGVNGGQNMGQDLLYSGTVAAALEAMMMGWRAMAVSAFSHRDQNFESAAWHAAELVDHGIAGLIAPNEILNVNCPNLPREEVRGYKVSRPGSRHYENSVEERRCEDGKCCYIVGGVPVWETEPGTDYQDVAAGYVVVSPLFPVFHKQSADRKVRDWLHARGLAGEV